MKNFSRLLAVVFIFMVIGKVTLADTTQEPVDYYTLGLQSAEQGNVEKALGIWLKAKANLEFPSTRIGVAFIKWTTKENFEKYYEFATLMYKWGLSAKKLKANKKAVRQIVEHLAVIVDDEQYQRWDEMLENNNQAIFGELRRLWQQMDITPTTTYNERLVEHWQRIAYSRVHFDQTDDEPFGADARAKIYVRYGEPDIVREGFLIFTDGTAHSLVSQIAQASLGSTSRRSIRSFVNITSSFHLRPEYKIWVYHAKMQGKNNRVYIFGSGRGKFRLIENIGEFIPSRAFQTGARLENKLIGQMGPVIGSISPALILQLMYYSQLTSIDYYFGSMYSTIMKTAVLHTPVTGGTSPEVISNRAARIIKIPKLRAPKQTSTIASKIVDIPLEIYTYRFLNKQNKPIVAVFSKSRPRKAFLIDYLHNYANRDSTNRKKTMTTLQNYRYINTVQLYDEEGRLLARANTTPTIKTAEKSASQSTFFVPSSQKGAVMVLSAMLKNNDTASSYTLKDLPFENYLRGIGTVRIEQPPPLSNNKNKLQMGELIVGYNYREANENKRRFPFNVAHDKKIPVGETIVVHVEVYHLQKHEETFGKLTLQYQIKPKEGFFGFLDDDQQPLQLALNIETKTSRYVQNLQIKTRELPPGDYTLMMTASDKQTGQRVKREFSFEIVEFSQ